MQENNIAAVEIENDAGAGFVLNLGLSRVASSPHLYGSQGSDRLVRFKL